MQPNPLPNQYGVPYQRFTDHPTYTQLLVDCFTFCLSPQELPRNKAARQYMDEELWIPIPILAKLPAMDSLYITDINMPFTVETLDQYARNIFEVDVAREMIRPIWALRSSVFISGVDENATTEQVYGLLDDIRWTIAHHENPFEYRNITITKQSTNAWTIVFKSPSAGPYAAMAMKAKCINGRMILPMACVHINPPRASYSSVGVEVIEIDALQCGDPVVPSHLVSFYSQNPDHINKLYRNSLTGYAPYEMSFHEQGPAANWPLENVNWTDWNALHENERMTRGYEQAKTPRKPMKCSESGTTTRGRHGSSFHPQPEDGSATADNIAREMEKPAAYIEQDSLENRDIPVRNCEDKRENVSHPLKKSDQSIQLKGKSARKIVINERDESEKQGNVATVKVITTETEVGADTQPKKDVVDAEAVVPAEEAAVEAKAVQQAEQVVEKSDRVVSTIPEENDWDVDYEGAFGASPSTESFQIPSFLTPTHSTELDFQRKRDAPVPFVEKIFQDRSLVKGRDDSWDVVGDFPSLAEAQKGMRVTRHVDASQGAIATKDQQNQARQRGSQRNGRQEHRRGTRNVPDEERHVDNSSNGANYRRKRHYRMRNTKDSHNGQLQPSRSWSHPEGPRSDGDRRTHGGRTDTTEKDDEWQVISYKKPVQRRGSRPGSASGASSPDDAGRNDRRGRRGRSPGSKSVA